ncbi:hypothetical protein CFC21_107179 [Triticum aestivum]|uniref:Embryo surrounding factor 1 brassicaceae domain-containing protein n=2 Tax=Triticum aestivum TaxID=4565 RepID=A0A9R1NAD4_WHEAT|nr:hypothetical protein CFC21_107179 [Triticum aestivum]
MRGSSLVHATMIFFIGFFVVCAQCVLDNKQTVVNQDGHAAKTSTNATIVNSTSAGESKITLIFCSRFFLCHFKDGHSGTCYCCHNKHGPCYRTRSECQDKCPTCNPKCPPSSGSRG